MSDVPSLSQEDSEVSLPEAIDIEPATTDTTSDSTPEPSFDPLSSTTTSPESETLSLDSQQASNVEQFERIASSPTEQFESIIAPDADVSEPSPPVPETAPVLEASPVGEASAVPEAAPALEASPVLEAAPVLEASSVPEASPALEASPIPEAAPVVEAAPEPKKEVVPQVSEFQPSYDYFEPDFKPKLWCKKLFDDGTELSPIICPQDVSDAQLVRQQEDGQRILPGININAQGQVSLLKTLGQYWKRIAPLLAWPASKEERGPRVRFFYENESYSYFDAMSLAALLSHLKPRRILAFVDQYQYACFMDIIDFLALDTHCVFIEPDPDRLENFSPLPANSPHKIICSNLKILPWAQFELLETGDVLFVDTTHVAKAGSDVCRLFGQVLPRLAPNVWAHLHDVFWPFEYPDGWLKEGRSWNELYVLRAWLQFNNAVDIKLFLNYLWHFHQKECEAQFPESVRNAGGALWIMKK